MLRLLEFPIGARNMESNYEESESSSEYDFRTVSDYSISDALSEECVCSIEDFKVIHAHGVCIFHESFATLWLPVRNDSSRNRCELLRNSGAIRFFRCCQNNRKRRHWGKWKGAGGRAGERAYFETKPLSNQPAKVTFVMVIKRFETSVSADTSNHRTSILTVVPRNDNPLIGHPTVELMGTPSTHWYLCSSIIKLNRHLEIHSPITEGIHLRRICTSLVNQ